MITYGSTTLTSYNTITKIEVYYYKSTSATSLSGGSWSTTKPTWENGKYIWQKIKTTYEGKLENGQYYSESDPVNITGQQGATGTAAYSYKLNSSDTAITVSKTGEYSVNKITFTATYKQGTGAVTAYAGRFKIETTANGTTWTTQYTSSGNESSKEYTIPEDIISIRCSLYQSGGTSTLLDIVTIPVVKDGIDAVGLRDSIPYYLASDKQTGVTRLDQGWTRFKPELTTEKRYLWVYYVSRYSEGDTQPELIEIKNDIVSFENHGDESPVENCVIDIEPVQDLHGYDSPWPAGGGVNLAENVSLSLSDLRGITVNTADDGTITINGTSEGTSFIRGYFHCPDQTATYTWAVFNAAASTDLEFSVRNSRYNPAGGWAPLRSANMTLTFTINSGETAVYWQFQVKNGATINNATLKPMIVSGSTAPTSYSPYSNICPITGWTGCEVQRTGKNLANAKFRIKVPSITNGQMVNVSGWSTEYIKVDNSKTYCVSVGNSSTSYLFYYDSNLAFIGSRQFSVSTRIGAESYFSRTSYIKLRNDAAENNDPHIQLELGSTATDYEPYTGQTYPITFPSEAGTVYGGVLDVTNGVLTVDRTMVDLGTLDWRKAVTAWTTFYSANIKNLIRKYADKIYTGGICSVYATDESKITSNGDNYIYGSTTGELRVKDTSKADLSTSEFKTAMDGVQFCYELAEPIHYPLTPIEITSLLGENNLWADTGQTSVTYYDNEKSTDPYVDYSATSAFEYSVKAYEATQPLYTNTYSELIGSANDVAGASFYFAKIHPDSYITNYKVKMKVRVIEPESYAETIDIQFGGYGSTFSSYDAYTTRTGSIGIYYINLYRATKAGIETNHKGHALGIGLRYATNPINIDYKRTVIVDILELDGCTIEMFDTAVKYADIDGTGSTNYSGITEMAVATVGQNATNNTNTNYTQYANAVKAGVFGVKRYTLLMKDSENTWSSFINQANSTATTKTVCQGGFLLGKLLYSAGGAEYASGANTSTVYDAYPFDFRYSTNCGQTLISHQPVYLVGTIENDGLFHLDVSQWYTQTEPTYADGKVYIYVGMAYSTYQVWLSTENPAYMFYNGEFILYDKAQTLQNINSLKNSLETQIDNKVETWCQKTNPASNWTAEERPNHTGDLWYYIGESGTTYKNNTTYQYNGETNVWSAYSANPDLFDKIDGKSAIYYGTTSSVTSAEEGDYLVDSENDCTYRWNNGAWILATDYKQVAIDAIEIGGRNLLLNTGGNDAIKVTTISSPKSQIYNINYSMENGEIHFTSVATTAERYYRFVTPAKENLWGIEPGETYTISFYTKGTIDANDNVGYRSQYTIGTGNWLTISDNRFKEKVGSDYQKVFFTETIPSNASSYFFSIQIYGSNASDFYIKNLKFEKGNKSTDWTPAPEDVEESIKAYAESIQSQVDGMAEIHYGIAVPTLSNAPASAWTDTATRDMHVDDLYYNTSTGYCYRFIKSGSTYSWSRIKDSDITAAATAAGNAQTTANNANTLAGQKRRIFVSQPTPPYEVGDLWVEGSSGDIKKCKTARASGSYTASDWELASKYTDDTTANEVNDKIDNLEIGGRNLLLNTNNFSLHKYANSSGGGTWTFSGDEATYTATAKSWARLDLSYNPDMPSADISSQPNMDLLGDTTITLSIEAKCEGECNGSLYLQQIIYGNNNNRKYYPLTNPTADCRNTFVLTENWQRYSVTIPADYTNTTYWTSDSTQLSYPNTGFGATIYWSSTGTVHVRKPKLERGQKATDWSPAPEDVETDINEAAKTANNYLSSDNTGIMVANMTDGNTYTPSTVPSGTKNTFIDEDSFQVRDGQETLASFGTTIVIGKSGTNNLRAKIGSGNFQIIDNSDNVLVNIGRVPATAGEAKKVHYEFGPQQSGTPSGNYSFAQGTYNAAVFDNQVVIGQYGRYGYRFNYSASVSSNSPTFTINVSTYVAMGFTENDINIEIPGCDYTWVLNDGTITVTIIGEGIYWSLKPLVYVRIGKDIAFAVGNGTENSRSDAFEVTWDGNARMALDETATTGTDAELYSAITALGWESEVIV